MNTLQKKLLVFVVVIATLFAWVSSLIVGWGYNPYDQDSTLSPVWSDGVWTKMLSWQHPSYFMVGQDNTDNPGNLLFGGLYLLVTIILARRMYTHKQYETLCAAGLVLIILMRITYWIPYWVSHI